MEFQTKTILTIVVLVALALAGAMYARSQQSLENDTFFDNDETVVCTQEAKQCPDGSYVGRTGPNCEFEACPTVATPPVVGGNPSVTPPPADDGIVCTMDAKQCPDGSWVGRSGPNCQFVCPGGNNSL